MISFTEPAVKSVARRDTLLPKLILGELRVKDAEKFINWWGES